MVRRLMGAGALLASLSAVARAHLMPAQRGTLNILDNAVFAALSLPVSGLTGIDDNRDGRLSNAELTTHMTALQAELARRVRFTNAGVAGRLDLVMPMSDADERDSSSTAGSTHLLVLMKATFLVPPTALHIDIDMFGTAANEQQLTLKATRGPQAEAAVLTPGRHAHTFFRAPWQIALDYLQLGVTHILGGVDHLLFLLTILVAAAGWRYWLGVLTSFTIAHSITLGLSLFNVVQLTARVVEPLIAASIVLMAVGNLRRDRGRDRGQHAGRQVAIVFACGLLHGLGFASALTALGLQGTTRISSLIGFNVGIEIGQALFLLTVLLLNAASGRLWPVPIAAPREVPSFWNTPIRNPRALSWLAAALGTVWCVQRLLVLR
ncbi:MAG: HupE/UreJ family protein [Gemmatimonadaceae bacterium]